MYELIPMLLDNVAKGRPGQKITPKGLVIHWTANTCETADADNNRNYFNYSGIAVSVHYIVDDHQVVQCLPEDEMAYHVGANHYTANALRKLSWYPNNCTLGIEICVNKNSNFTTTIRNAVELCANICKRHGWNSDHLWRHYDITGKDCPKFFVDDDSAVAYGFASAATGWLKFRADVDLAIANKQASVPGWKQDIMQEAQAAGLIHDEHHADDPASKWFVLAVALNTLQKLEGK